MRIVVKVALIAVAVIIVGLIAFYAYYGGFKKVSVGVKADGGEMLVYRDVVGDYAQTPEVFNEIYYALLNDYQVETHKGFGIFYDNPGTVEKSKLRSEVGCILEDEDSHRVIELEAGFNVKTLSEAEYMVAEFPHKGMISIMLGIMKVYPALTRYVKKHGYAEAPVVEIYDVPNKKIIYMREVIRK
jgi:DNA gyrase inhibitor GyrI